MPLLIRPIAVCLAAASLAGLAKDAGAQTAATARWINLKESGFAVPAGARAVDLLVEMNTLLASPDPKLRDEVAYSAADNGLFAIASSIPISCGRCAISGCGTCTTASAARVENVKQILRSLYAAAEAALAKNPGSLPELTESAKAVLATLSAMP